MLGTCQDIRFEEGRLMVASTSYRLEREAILTISNSNRGIQNLGEN